MIKRSDYKVELYYGYEETDCGIYHAFEAVGIGDGVDSDEMCNDLAMSLDCLEINDYNEEVLSERFNCDSMLIALPQSVVDQIKSDAIKEYLESQKKEFGYNRGLM